MSSDASTAPQDSKPLAGKTVVITGASSGIGRAAAVAFAREGARVVLAARRAEKLEEVAQACREAGAEALVVPTDVADAEAVKALAEAAYGRFGAVDVWINNAGLGVVGPYAETDMRLHRRTIEVNLLGSMHGAAAIVPRFVAQGHGVLINNISLGAWSPIPFAAAYSASKFGLRGFTAALRQELLPHPGIHVCGVFPSMVDTPGFAHGANTSGKSLDPGPFLYTAQDVAETFVRVAREPRPETVVGWPSLVSRLGYGVTPMIAESVVGVVIRRLLSIAKPGPKTDGALLSSPPDAFAESGGWLGKWKTPPAGVLSIGLGVVGAVGLLAGMAALRPRRRD